MSEFENLNQNEEMVEASQTKQPEIHPENDEMVIGESAVEQETTEFNEDKDESVEFAEENKWEKEPLNEEPFEPIE